MIRTALFLFLAVGMLPVFSQKPPYDVFPEAEAPYYRVRYEATPEPGKLMFAVQYTVWIPPEVERLRGIVVHQHGCGEGSCKSGLTGAWDLHWQALAKKHDCALMAPSYEQPQKADCQMWCDPRNGSDATFRQSLVDLGLQSGHPELATVPWALWGHSGGGHWCGGMVMLHPERVAAAWLRSGVPLFPATPPPDRPAFENYELTPQVLKVPMMCNLGTKEGVTVKEGRFVRVWPVNEHFLRMLRVKNALVGVAVDPLSAHECGNQRYLAIRWLDACLTERLPEQPGAPLKAMPTHAAFLAPFLGKKAVAETDYVGDKTLASWLPNQAVADLWTDYVRDSAVPDTTPPPAPFGLEVAPTDKGNLLTWQVEADLESGLARCFIVRDGKRIAAVPKDNKNRFGRPVFQGLQYSDTPTMPLVRMRFVDADAEPGKKHRYRVVAENTVGLKSALSK